MIVFLMTCKELLIAQIHNVFRMPAGTVAVAIIREHESVHFILQHLIGRGKSTLHLIEHDTGIYRILALPQLITPALLTEDLRLVIDGRMKYSIQIHIQKI